MGNKFEPLIKLDIERYGREKNLFSKRVGNAAINEFKDNWRKQGFDGKPWEQRKVVQANRAILVKTGRLRREFNQSDIGDQIIIENTTPYAGYHNEGTKNIPQRKFMGKMKSLDEKIRQIINKMFQNSIK